MFKDILEERLRINICTEFEKRKSLGKNNVNKIHKSSLDGLVSVLCRTLLYSESNKHFTDGHYDGNHIMSSELNLLVRNKLAQEFIHYNLTIDGEYNGKQFPFFKRSDNSTYHANNAKFGKSNGYSHWYEYNNLIKKSLHESYSYFEYSIGFSNKFGAVKCEYEDKLRNLISKPDNLDLSKYLVVSKDKFEILFQKFMKGLCEGVSTLINRLEYTDNNYVYILNILKTDNRLDGRCREYTTLSLLRQDIRKYILSENTEIDLNSSVQTIFLNLFYDLEMNMTQVKKDFPEHYELLTNKKAFRQKVADKFKVSIDDAKQIITSITYSPKSRIIFKHCSLREFSQKRTDNCKKMIEPFIKETIIIREKIINQYYNNNELMKKMIDSDIKNANEKLKGRGKGKSLDDRRIFRIYEMFESIIRNQMINYIKNHGNDLVYQIHDCVIFKNEINVRDLQEYIQENSKFYIGVTRTMY